MKFSVGQKVYVPAWVPEGLAGVVVHAFVVKRFAAPDVNHYNVKVGKTIIEFSEEELS